MTKTTFLAVVSVGVLWLGKLLPKVPPQLVDPALAGMVGLLGGWFVYLSRGAWANPADGLGPWQTRALPIGAALGMGVFALAGVGYAVSTRVLRLAPPPEVGLIGRPLGQRFWLLLLAALGAAILEEWVFRGVLLDRLSGLPLPASVVISALLFAAYHGSLFQLLPTFLLGAALATAVCLTDSLWPAIVAHGLFNLLGLVLGSLTMRAGP